MKMYSTIPLTRTTVGAFAALAAAACGSQGANSVSSTGSVSGAQSGAGTSTSRSSNSGVSGQSSTGNQSSSAASSASCNDVTACGGSPVGTWTASSSCLQVSGPLNPQAMFGLSCTTAQATGSVQVTGTWTIHSDGSYTDGTTTTGTEQFTLPSNCLVLSGTTTTCSDIASVIQGGLYDTVTCNNATGGGCDCTATINQAGDPGLAFTGPSTTGTYTTANNVLTNADSLKYSYCVSGNTLTVTPQSTNPTLTGTIAFQGSGSSTSGSSSSPATGTSSSSTSSKSTSSSSSSSTGSMARGQGPCDIYAAASTPCAAAYSMVRGLYQSYAGPLYQVRAGSSSTNTGTGGTGTKDIGMTSDGYADTATQDSFCNNTVCTVSILYDQSGNKNNLTSAPAGLSGNGARTGDPDYESSATKLSLTAGGHKVYALYMNEYEGYRTGLGVVGKNMPLGNTSQGIYELADGTHYGTACCWDFGNVTTNPANYHTMNTLFFGTGFWGKGAGSGPWFEADVEGGVWAGGAAAGDPGGSNGSSPNTNSPSMHVNFAFGTVKTSSGKYEIRVADASTATNLTTTYNGTAPVTWDNQGGILLGIGGDNSNNSSGTFFEGAITAGLPADATDLNVLKNVQAVQYTK